MDGAFDKIGGVSSGSAGKTQEASRQPAEVVKCNQVKNHVSMEIAHPQASSSGILGKARPIDC